MQELVATVLHTAFQIVMLVIDDFTFGLFTDMLPLDEEFMHQWYGGDGLPGLAGSGWLGNLDAEGLDGLGMGMDG